MAFADVPDWRRALHHRADLRKEQDIQRELDVLYRYMNQQASESSLKQTPQVAEQMRQQVAELSRQRQILHQHIKTTFPNYAQMVRPLPPTAAQMAAQLRDDEVFVQILSTENGTYIWAIDRQHGVIGARSALDEATLARLVQRLRATLDVADQGAQAFDFAAAAALHSALLQPVLTSLTGKAHGWR